MSHPALLKEIKKQIEFSTDTCEHIFSNKRPPLASGLQQRFEVVQRPIDSNVNNETAMRIDGHDAIVELISVTPDNKLLHIRPDSSSDSGWKEFHIDLPEYREDGQKLQGDVCEIDAFYQFKRIIALIQYRTGGNSKTVLPMVFEEDKGWRELRLEGDIANALYQTTQTDVYRTPNGYHFFYGISTAYDHPHFFVVFENAEGELAAATERVKDTSASYRLLPKKSNDGEYGHSCLCMTKNNVQVSDFFLEYDEDEDSYYIEWGESQADANLGFGDISATNTYPFPSRLTTQSLLVLDNDKQLHYVAGYAEDELRSKALTGADNQPKAISQVTVGRLEDDRAIVFALSAIDSRLWVLRQNGKNTQGDIEFSDWVCLGNHASVIGSPRAMLDGAELFLVDKDTRTLEHMRQSETTSFWANTPVMVAQASGEKSVKGEAHAVLAEVKKLTKTEGGKGEYSQPLPNAALEIQTSYSCQVSINGLTLRTHANKWVPVSTDDLGKLSLYLPADDLQAPEISLRITETGEVFKIAPNNRLTERLRGKDLRFTIDAKSLKSAGLIPKDASGNQAQAIAKMVRQIGRNAEKETNTVKRMKLSSGNAQDVDVQMKTIDCTINEQLNKSVLGDILNFIKKSAEKVKDFVCTVGKGIVELAVTIGKQVVKFAVNTAQDILKTAESLFHMIGKAFEAAGKAIVGISKKVIKFFASVLGWDDILITHDVLKFTTNQTFKGMQKSFGEDVVNWADDQIEHFKSSLDDMFNQVEGFLAPLDPTNASSQERMMASDKSGQGEKLAGKNNKNKTSTELISSNVMRHTKTISDTIKNKVKVEDDDPLKQFIETVTDKYKQRIETDCTDIFKNFKPDSPAAFFQDGIISTFRLVRPLFMFALEVGGELFKLAMRGIARIIKLVEDVLNFEIKIPLISDMYETATDGRPLTILSALTLIAAVPMTFIYKLLNKGKAPFSKDHLEKLEATGKTWTELFEFMTGIAQSQSPIEHKSVGSAATKEEVKEPSTLKKSLKFVLKILGVIQSVIGLAVAFLKPIIIGFTMLKQTLDSKDISGTSGTAVQATGRLAKFLDLVLALPRMLWKLVKKLLAKPKAALMKVAKLFPKNTKVLTGQEKLARKTNILRVVKKVAIGGKNSGTNTAKTGVGTYKAVKSAKVTGTFVVTIITWVVGTLTAIIGIAGAIVALPLPKPGPIISAIVDVINSGINILLILSAFIATIVDSAIDNTVTFWSVCAELLGTLSSFLSEFLGIFSLLPPIALALNAFAGMGEILIGILFVLGTILVLSSLYLGLADYAVQTGKSIAKMA